MKFLALWFIRLMSASVFIGVCFFISMTLEAKAMGLVVIGILFIILGLVSGICYPNIERKLAAKFKLYS